MSKNRTFLLVLGGILLLAFGVAVSLTREASIPFIGGGEERELLASLDGQHEMVAAIEISEEDVETRLERDGDTWRMATKDGYPVDSARVSALLGELDRLEGLKMVSDNPADFGVYGLLEDDGGTALRLFDESGELVAGLVVGTVVSDPEASDLIASHVRLERADEIWLMDGELQVESEPLVWIGENLLAIDRSRIYEIRTAAGDPEQSLVIQRTAPTSQTFVAANLPEDVELEGPWILSDIIAPLERVVMEDVRQAEETDAEPLRAEVRTVDGLKIGIDLFAEESAVWAEIDAEAIDRMIVTDEFDDNGLDAGPGDLGSYLTPAQVEEEIAYLRARTEGWQFRLPVHVVERLTMTIQEAGEQESRI